MENGPPTGTQQHESFGHHPIHATVEEAEHLREVADKGESPATLAIVVGVVFAFVLVLAGILILLAFAVSNFA